MFFVEEIIESVSSLAKRLEKKNNRHHHKICNGYNGTYIGFNGNCNGPCWSLLVIGQLQFVAC